MKYAQFCGAYQIVTITKWLNHGTLWPDVPKKSQKHSPQKSLILHASEDFEIVNFVKKCDFENVNFS